MNVPAIVSIVAGINSIGVAALAWRISRAPNWTQKRYFALVALCAGVYAGCDALSFSAVGNEAILLAMRVQGAAATLHGGAWFLYTFAYLRMGRPRTLTAMLAVCGVLSALWLVPGVMMTDQLSTFTVPWMGVTYTIQLTTSLGSATLAADGLILLVPIWLYLRARHRVRGAGLHAAGLSVIVGCGLYDVVLTVLLIELPFTLPLAFLVSIAAVGISVTTAFVDSANELDLLTKKLEHLVEERTSKLLATEYALARSEKLAAIGKLAAGVAHEINNPAAAVAANLQYLRSHFAQGALPEDAAECLDDSSDAIERIALIVRQLLDSTRTAASPKSGSASVGRAIEQAIATLRPQLDGRVQVEVDAQAELYARADESSLVQVLVNLIANGLQAIPPSQERALLRVRARESGGRITVEVHDNGSGIPEHVRGRLFEPFFTTKPLGQGTGLGLSVSLGLVRSMGGEIEVESGPGSTNVRVHVPTVTARGTSSA